MYTDLGATSLALFSTLQLFRFSHSGFSVIGGSFVSHVEKRAAHVHGSL